MKDKISKLKNLVKKYGLAGTIKKAAGYIYSNYLVKLSVKERIYVAVNKKKFIEGIDRILSKNSYDRIVIWRSSLCLCTKDLSIFSAILRSKERLSFMK